MHKEAAEGFPIELEQSPILNGLDERAKRELLVPLSGMVERSLPVAKIEMLLRGGVRTAENPPEKISHAVASINYNGGQPRLTIYDGFFAENNRGRDHIIRHELGHVMTDLIFSHDELENITAAARDNNADVSNLSPYGQMFVEMVRNPSTAAALEHRGEGSHLHRELTKLNELASNPDTDPETTAKARAALVREIIADRIANYFECDGSVEGYGRLRFSQVEGGFDENDPRFAQEQALFEVIRNGINNNENWQLEPELADDFWEEEIYYEPEEILPPSRAETLQPAATPPSPTSQDNVSKFLRWLTGNK